MRSRFRRACALAALAAWLTSPAAAQTQPAGDSPVPDRGESQKIEKAETAESTPPRPADRWRFHIPRKRARELEREIIHAPFAVWNPAHRPILIAKEKLHDWGFLVDLDVAFYEQYASEVASPNDAQHNAGTFAWQLVGDFRIAKWKLGKTYLEWTTFGTVGFDYDSARESLSRRVGSISLVNNNVYPNGGVVDEFYLKHVTPDGRFALLLGRVDMLYHFDTNRVANDGYRQFFTLALENNLSLPAPTYGGFGGIGVWNISDKIYLMAGVGDSTSNEQVQPWNDIGDNSWWVLAELGISSEISKLGEGNLRITPWYNTVMKESGFGFGINIDQEIFFPWLIAFFRFGFGDADVTPVRLNVSGGVSIENPFGGKHQNLGVGFSWADPSPGFGRRAETLFEAYYRWRFTRSMFLTPDLQVIIHPANGTKDVALVGGLRLMLEF